MRTNQSTPISGEAIEQLWPEFVRVVHSRLEMGRLQYGDESFSRSPAYLMNEMEQEALDIVGWGFILWCRLKTLRAKSETGI